MRLCIDCNDSISHRGYAAKRCVPCAYFANLNKTKARYWAQQGYHYDFRNEPLVGRERIHLGPVTPQDLALPDSLEGHHVMRQALPREPISPEQLQMLGFDYVNQARMMPTVLHFDYVE